MKRNNQYAVSGVPLLRYKRSAFDLSHRVLTSGTVGNLYPFELQEVLPGDTFKIDTTLVTRLSSTFAKPIMDNLFADIYFFFVPNRLVFDKWAQVFGDNNSSAWAPAVETLVPVIQGASSASTYTIPTAQNGDNRTISNCFGMPAGATITLKAGGLSYDNISVLPFRAFALIYNEFFRDQNNIDPVLIHTGDAHSSEYLNNSPFSASNYMGCVPKVAKMHDYFTSALPAPQKGSAVDIPVQGSGFAPVVPLDENIPYPDYKNLRWGKTGGGLTTSQGIFGNYPSSNTVLYSLPEGVERVDYNYLYPANLWTDLSQADPGALGIMVNDLRFAVQYQKMLEKAARSGTRYIEYLLSNFGVSAGDTRLQRPEYIGGKRIPLSVTQVTQTTGFSDDTSSQTLGQLGAYSLSAGKTRFTKSFVEHGYVIGVYCIRQFHSYQQGLSRHWFRRSRTDFYDPVFASIGEQPVYKYQLYADAITTGGSKPIFGYQEAWAEYRANQNIITGQMSSYATDSMELWHLGDKYSNAPVLGKAFIEETASNVDRTITVESTAQDQFILDFWVNNIATRVMPTYSVPGLVDHH